MSDIQVATPKGLPVMPQISYCNKETAESNLDLSKNSTYKAFIRARVNTMTKALTDVRTKAHFD